MTCIVILEVTAKKGAGMQLVETFRALLPDTRNKDGCQGVEVTTNLNNADNLVLVQRWATRKHYENYLAWRQQRGDVDKLAEDAARPSLFFPMSAACWQPYFKGHTMMVNGNYNGWRFEDVWLDK
jgi:quinol monooxygenase YgiN